MGVDNALSESCGVFLTIVPLAQPFPSFGSFARIVPTVAMNSPSSEQKHLFQKLYAHLSMDVVGGGSPSNAVGKQF